MASTSSLVILFALSLSSSLVACELYSFDEFDISRPPPSPSAVSTIEIRGTIEGLESSQEVDVSLNGDQPKRFPNGPFAITATLQVGDTFSIAAEVPGGSSKCVIKDNDRIKGGKGVIASTGTNPNANDNFNVQIHCAKTCALTNLTLDYGTLSPSFSASTHAYTVKSLIPELFGPQTEEALHVEAPAHCRVEVDKKAVVSSKYPITRNDKELTIEVIALNDLRAVYKLTQIDLTSSLEVQAPAGAIHIFNEDLLAIGPREGELANRSVQVFRHAPPRTWVKLATLTSPAFADVDDNVDAIAASGDWIAVGVRGRDENTAGIVRLFRRGVNGNSWIDYDTSLKPLLGDQLYGGAIALRGDTLVVGSPRNNLVDVYRRDGDTWNHAQELSGPVAGADFGSAVDILPTTTNTIVVGARRDGDDGAAYLYNRATSTAPFTGPVKVSPPEPLALGYFGEAVVLRSNVLVVGRPGSKPSGAVNPKDYPAGAVFVFRRDAASGALSFPPTRLEGDVKDGRDAFGKYIAVSTDEQTIAVGAAEARPQPGAYDGAAYLFRWNGTSNAWSSFRLISPLAPGGSFGVVALTKDALVVGSIISFRVDAFY